jgi:hypothetical protein
MYQPCIFFRHENRILLKPDMAEFPACRGKVARSVDMRSTPPLGSVTGNKELLTALRKVCSPYSQDPA